MRLALAQINTVVGDLDGNRDADPRPSRRGAQSRRGSRPLPRARRHRLPAGGSAPPARVRRRRGARRSRRSPRTHATSWRSSASPTSATTSTTRAQSARTASVKAIYRKRFLPNYGVFDEDRYFAPGRDLVLLELGGTLVGVTICEDMWQPGPPATDLALAGAELLVNISASPFHVGKEVEREEMFVTRARDNACFVAFCNAVGGQDELIFDGHSCVLDDEGAVVARAPGFEEATARRRHRAEVVIGRRLRDVRRRALARERETLRRSSRPRRARAHPRLERQAIDGAVAGSRRARADAARARARPARLRARRTASRDVVIGVSGGIDSAVTAALAAEALGAGARALRLDAVALLVRGDAHRRPPACREPRLRLPRDHDRADGRGVHGGAARGVRGPRGRSHRGEPAGAHPRRRS